MREAAEQYGKSIGSALAVLLVCYILFAGIKSGDAVGLSAILGDRFEISGVDYSVYKDGEQSGIVLERKQPEIRFLENEISVGKPYAPEDWFVAEDEEGKPAEIRIIKAFDQAGMELETVNGAVTFVTQGNYRLFVKVSDNYCVGAEHEFLIPVKRR